MPETPGTRKLEHDAAVTKSPLEIPVYSDAEYEMLEDEHTFTEAPWHQEQIGQTFFELAIREDRLLQNARLSHKSDSPGWNEKRHGAHSDRDTAALGRPRRP